MSFPDGFGFEIVAHDGRARVGKLTTPHGIIDTPAFMPVGTQGVVKALSGEDLEQMKAQVYLVNTYHLYLRPGVETVESMGGIHRFASWPHALLSDSGGYQIFSHRDKIKIDDDGVTFQSHFDGSYHNFTPEKAIEIQRRLRPDIIMSFDQCVSYPATRDQAEEGVRRTSAWAGRGQRRFAELERGGQYAPQMLFGIVQGSVYEDLRKRSAQEITALDFPGYSIGGLSVGEPKDEREEMLNATLPFLPVDRPRYLMGVGYPEDIFAAVERGIDMFDCVLPTRNARTGLVFTAGGPLNFRNASAASDDRPLDPHCDCFVCRRYSRAYLRHLYSVSEITVHRLTSYHSVNFYLGLMRRIREAVADGSFADLKKSFMNGYDPAG